MDGHRAQLLRELLAEATGAILVFVWLSLEVRHFFDPGFERGGLAAEGIELYAYSIVWLLFGVALLAFGFWRNVRPSGMPAWCWSAWWWRRCS